MEKKSGEKNTDKQFLVVGIGASAGGIKALKEFFSKMPADSGMSFAVILHLTPEDENTLSKVLKKATAMPVHQVVETVEVKPNNVYIIPSAKRIEIAQDLIEVKETLRAKDNRVPIDNLFRSMAEGYGKKSVCIILSGTGTDGKLGMRHIKGQAGFAIVQEPLEAEFDEMPRSAIETQIADIVLPVSEMPEKLLFIRDSNERFKLTDEKDNEVAKEIKNIELFHDLLTLIRIRTGHDFSNYNRPTLIRRVARHLQVHETDNLSEYLDILREKPDEVISLFKNLLINVTNFFRDKEAFKVIEKKIIPALFDGKSGDDHVRIWIAGCASGEEAYSLAILLSEYAATLSDPPKIQIFASDVDESAIIEAREGHFTKAIVTDVSPERLWKFFVKDVNGYHIRKHIREMILFTQHNILHDSPFSRLDFISCRNLLIYLNRTTQRKILQMFHFALQNNGYLFLGSSESADSQPSIFSAIDKKYRIYQSRPSNTVWNETPQLFSQSIWTRKFPDLPIQARRKLQSFGELHHRLIEYYAPPSILVNEEDEILHLSENAGRFLRFVGGEPTANLLKIIHPDLLSNMRTALFIARQKNIPVETKNIAVKFNKQEELFNLIVRPVKTPEAAALVIFEEAASQSPKSQSVLEVIDGDKAMESVVKQLESDLQNTKDQLHNTIEQYETTVEELKASNEELQAMNEELRTAGEELETGKEELQSVNEEIITVNQELKEKIEEVSRINSDLQNLIQSTDIATIFLDSSFKIKRFTPRTGTLFNIIPSDINRPIAHLTHHLDHNDFQKDAAKVLKTLQPFEREMKSSDNRFFIARFTPYRTMADKIDGVVIIFIDITERKKAEEKLRYVAEFDAFRIVLSDALRLLSDPIEIQAAAMRILGEHLQVNRVIYAEIEADGEIGVISDNYVNGVSKLVGQIPTSNFGKSIEKLKEGKPFSISDINTDPDLTESERSAFITLSIISSLGVPLMKEGRWVAKLSVHQETPRIWRDDELALLQETIERIWGATERAAAEKSVIEDLRDTQLLRELGTQLVSADNIQTLYKEIMNAAIRLTKADAGTVQILDDKTQELVSIATEGFESDIANLFYRINPERTTPSGIALITGERTFVDFESSIFEDSEGSIKIFMEAGYLSAQSTPLVARSGKRIGIISTYWREAHHQPAERQLRFLDLLARQAADLIEQRQIEEALRSSQEKLALELSDTKHLQRISSQLIQEDNINRLYEQILDAAIAIMHSDMGSMQMFFPERNELLLLTWKGFHPQSASFWKVVKADSTSSCGIALLKGERVIVPDIETCELMNETEDLKFYRLSQIRAVQSTPLISRGGRVVGMISNHWRKTHQPNERNLRLLDVLARQAADLIDHKYAEEQIRISEARLQRAVQTARMVVWEWNPSLNQIQTTGNFEEIYGLSKIEFAEEGYSLLHPDDQEKHLRLVDGIKAEGGNYHSEFRIIRPDTNQTIWIEEYASAILDDRGEVKRIIGAALDVTERKRTEEELRESKNRLDLALDSAKTGIHIWNIAENTLFWDERLREIWNLSSDVEVNYEVFAESLHPDDRKATQEIIDLALDPKGDGKYFAEFRIINKNNQQIRWVLATGQVFFADEKPIRLIGTARDITAHKEIENNLRAKDKLLSQIMNLTPTMLARCSRDLKYLFVNTSTAEFLGFPVESIIGKPIREIIGAKAFATILPKIEMVLQGNRVEFETEVPYATAGRHFMHVVYLPEWDYEGKVIGWFATITNITERKKAEETNSFLASIVESSDDAIISKDLNGIITSWNKSAERMFGYKTEEVIGKSITILIPHTLIGEEAKILKQLRKGRQIKHYETVRQRKDGTLLDVSLTISLVKDNLNNIIGVSKIVRDISERKQAEAALREQQYFTQNIIEAAPSLTYIYDLINGYNLFISHQTEEILGYTVEEIRNMGANVLSILIHPDDAPRVAERFTRISADKNDEVFTLEYRMQRKDGVWIWLWSRDRIFRRDADGNPTQILGVANDITTRKEQEEQLRRSEEFHSIISTISTDWAFSAQVKPNGRVIPDAITSGFTKQLGYTLKNLSTDGSWKTLIHPEDLPLVLKQMKRLLRGETVRGKLRNVSKSGHIIISEYQVRPIIDESGRVIRIYGAIRDITQQKLSEQFIKESEERLRSVIESATEYAIFTLTPEGKVNSWSSGAKNIFGYADYEIIGQSADILFTVADRQKNVPAQEMQTALKRGRASDDRFHLRKDGSQFFTSGVMMPIVKNGKAEGFVKIARDMTTQILAKKAIQDKEMLQKLVNAQEEERRRIARDLHDELGQQLTALRLKLENARRICDDEIICQEIDNIQLIAKQIDHGVDFLAWELRPAALDDLGLYPALEKYIKEWSNYSGVATELLPSTIKGMRFPSEIETNLYRIVQEALNNIHKHAQAEKAEIVIEKRDDIIILLIADDGKGFNPNSKHNNNKGIGLIGMQERAILIGGNLEIESAIGEGTTIYVRVPVSFTEKENVNE